jgi:DNA-binding PadR family transcriptional regulator
MLRYIILGLLRGGAACHGYALVKAYRERSGVSVSPGNFYRELQRLVGEALVRTATNPLRADPRRAPYTITEQGMARFDEWLTEATGRVNRQCDDDLSSRALFIGLTGDGTVRAALDAWQGELWFQEKILERARRAAVEVAGDDPECFSPLPFLIARRMKCLAVDLEFIDELRAAYEDWATGSSGIGDGRETAAGR